MSSILVLLDFDLSFSSLCFCLVTFLFLYFITCKFISKRKSQSIPITSFWDFLPHLEQHIQYTSNALLNSATSTLKFYFSPFHYHIITANPANVKHILKDRFEIYDKAHDFMLYNYELLGEGIFNTNGEKWKFQRKISNHEFSTNSLRKFVEDVVNIEIYERLIPLLSEAAENESVLDLQDIFQRFTLDTICKIAFGYDPMCLLPNLPEGEFAVAFDEAVKLSHGRFFCIYPIIWKTKRFFNIGSEKNLKNAVYLVRKFAREVINKKKTELKQNLALESADILSRFLSSGIDDDKFVSDVIINFILAGRDTTSTALTWFFWLLSNNPEVENEILAEIKGKSEIPTYDEMKDMVYIHASLSECLRLYPPVSVDLKVAMEDDVLPSGFKVKKGEVVAYQPYAMGRLEESWGKDYEEFRPARWLETDEKDGSLKFVAKDTFTYPVFQAGPRICLGKDMAYLQMKRVVAEVLRRYKVVPVFAEGVEPLLVSQLTIKMKDGLPVKIKER